MWEVESGHELRTLEGHTSDVAGVALSGVGQLAAPASSDHTVKVWEVESGVRLATFTCDSAAYCGAFSEAPKLVCGGYALELPEGSERQGYATRKTQKTILDSASLLK